jgi:SAM-dependent methyltransferase
VAESVVQQQYDQLAKITIIGGAVTSPKPPFSARLGQNSAIRNRFRHRLWHREFERLLLKKHPQQAILGIDLSSKMLSVAREKLKDYAALTLCQSSVTAIPAADESFDVVVCANAFHYFESSLAALAEMRRVLKPNGRVVILDWCKDFLFCRLYDVILSILDPAHKQCYTQAELHSFLTSSQFNIQAAKRLRLNLVWGLMIATAVKP